MISNILIEVLGSIAEEERVKIKQRQKEGIAKKEGSITAVEFTKLLGYKSRNTTYKKIRQYEEGIED